MEDARASRLAKFFIEVIQGRKELKASRDGKLFIESVCAKDDRPAYLHQITTSSKGIDAVQKSMRFDTSPAFLNGSGLDLLKYLQEPSLASIDSGSVLAQVLINIVEPPFFWDALVKAFREGTLSTPTRHAFSWLILQLLTLPGISSPSYLLLAKSADILDSILKADDGATRIIGEKIKHVLTLEPLEQYEDAVDQPGGRHNNDHANHRLIAIMPTADELLSTETVFLRTPEYLEDDDSSTSRSATHLDNQFRLLREDMLLEVREELKILTGKKPGRHRGIILNDLKISGIDMGNERKRHPWAIDFDFNMPQLKHLKPEKWKSYLLDNNHILRHGNIACLMLDGEPAAFPTIYRDVEKLSKVPSKVTLQFQDDSTLAHALLKIKSVQKVQLVQLDTATFAFEPFLKRLQEMQRLPLKDEILHWSHGNPIGGPHFAPEAITSRVTRNTNEELKDILGTAKSVRLDESQTTALVGSLSQRVSLVQGPPGTGKSFVGALSAKVIYDQTDQVILVVCFTNHALDQFLEDLLDIGIPPSAMVRLGGKSTDRTKSLMVREQVAVKIPQSHYRKVNDIKAKMLTHDARLRDAFKRYNATNFTKQEIMEYLEFCSEELPYYDAFSVADETDSGMTRVGKWGKKMGKFYLLDRWTSGAFDAGSLSHLQPKGAADIWKIAIPVRRAILAKWRDAVLSDHVQEIQERGREFNTNQKELDTIFSEKDASIIKSKRIIACTTNGAAKYSSAIASAEAGVVLVEEAGEILEAHILTALSSHTQQLILIGDHKQLRPKCSYELSVGQMDGFDLNRSLFERLVLKGFPHVTLTKQHRMRPEISSMIRHLTYPDLTDAISTGNRSDLRGFQDNVVFFNHAEPEDVLKGSQETKDGKTLTKQNRYEAQMVLKIVKYLAQQGYGSDKLVVLTPYVGQLKLLREELSKENDPILNDLDRGELVKAGLLTDLSSKRTGPSLRISTIDNYQGEESEITIVSMTRSNKSYDIGFMSAPERLNVMLSRARDGLIMIGNAETFMKARKGKEVYCKLFDHLNEHNHVYDGVPIKCEKHPDRVAVLSSPEDFEINCPDGGCKEPCGAMLKCNVHKCPSRCHQIFDHSKIRCMTVLKQKCSKGHNQSWYCHSGAAPSTCATCERGRREAERKAQKLLREKQKRQEEDEKHSRELAKIQDEIDRIAEELKDNKHKQEQTAALAQKKADLIAAKALSNKNSATPPPAHVAANNSTTDSSSPDTADEAHSSLKKHPVSGQGRSIDKKALATHIKSAVAHNKSPAKTEWQRLKDQENAVNPAIDDIMEMTGLEDVKQSILTIRSKVELAIRQGTDLKKERLGLVLLGNPGTGKTTVARHYAKVLSSLQVIEGDGFIESSGSSLAHGGIKEVKDSIDQLSNAKGGIFFIDEAYQLVEGNSPNGKAVLDYLLTTIEDLVGSVVFVFAGYRKQMEKFFEHNPGFDSRIPYRLVFEDYTNSDLLYMLQSKMVKFYKKTGIKIEDGPDGLFMNIAIKRLGSGRGTEGFGNARALENLFGRIKDRQAVRIAQERKDGLLPDDLFIAKEDLIGPDPSSAILQCPAWDKLQQLTGLSSVKASISFMIELIKTNYKRELDQKDPVQVSLNRVFLGSPGTGKTTVAKLYGQILAHLGLLSNGEVVVKNPADFIGQYIGQSEANTKAVLKSTIGKVLIIDEAYMLHTGSDTGGNTGTFKTAVIDTIVAEVQGVPGEDRCVLLLGYEDEMKTFFQNTNPGLTRRFQLSDAFKFEDFSDSELQEILNFKLQSQGLGADAMAVKVAIDVLGRLRMGLNFGNGGAVENLISKAKSNFQQRQSRLTEADRSIDFNFAPEDFDPDYDRGSGAETNLQKLFEGVIGCDAIVDKLDGYLKVAKGMRAQDLDPRSQIPTNFIFKGPPGTGKTTTARKIGQVYYDLGFLSEVEVVECSASDLIGQYIGQTGPKTIKVLERGLGKVLFIDEAYRLGEGHFAQEAVSELVDTMTKPKFAGKMVIILAGYDNDINKLLRVNEGLSSRFADEMIFPSLSVAHCLQLLNKLLLASNVLIPEIQTPTACDEFMGLLTVLSELPAWGNARDVQTLAKSMIREAYRYNTTKVAQLSLSYDTALSCIKTMVSDRKARQIATTSHGPKMVKLPQEPQQSFAPAPTASSSNSASTSKPTSKSEKEAETPPKPLIPDEEDVVEAKTEPKKSSPPRSPDEDGGRDSGVSDANWEQLQRDRKAAEVAAQDYADMQKRLNDQVATAKQEEDDIKAAAITLQASHDKIEESAVKLAVYRNTYNDWPSTKKSTRDGTVALEALQKAEDKNRAEAFELGRQREANRIKELEAKAEYERVQDELRRIQELQKKEQQVQQKLSQMGVCCMGFRWIKQAGGYRCAGGSHYVSDSQLGI